MAFISKETPSGLINGVNTTFTLANTAYQIDDIWVDGAIYETYTLSGNTLTLSNAPTISILVDYWTTIPSFSTGYTLSDLLSLLTEKLGTEVATRFTEEKKIKSLNYARKRILLEHDIEEFINDTEIAFTSGVGSLPLSYLRMTKEVNSEGVTKSIWTGTDIYQKVSITRFDEDIDYTWTFKGNNLYIYPADSITLDFRYIYLPADMSDDNDLSGFTAQMEDILITLATWNLLFNDRQYEIAAQMWQQYLLVKNAQFPKYKGDRGISTSSSFNNAMLDETFII